MDADKTTLIEFGAKILAWLAKPLYFRANVKPILHKTKKHLKNKYGDELVESPDFKLKLGCGNPTLEHGIFRVYVPPSELFRKLNENRESMLIQSYIRNALVPDLQIINKEFHDALCINETNEVLEKDKNAKKKVRHYNRQILEKNPNNTYITPVAVASEQNDLKPVLKKAIKIILADSKKTGRISSKTGVKLKRDLQIEKNKWIREIETTTNKLDTLSDKDLIKSTSKSIFEYSRIFTAEPVVKSIIQQKHLRTKDGKILSYVLVAEVIRDNPGITSKKLAQILGKPEVSYIQYGIVALLDHKKGLNLIERKKMGSAYKLYPSKKFIELLKKLKYNPKQREISEFG